MLKQKQFLVDRIQRQKLAPGCQDESKSAADDRKSPSRTFVIRFDRDLEERYRRAAFAAVTFCTFATLLCGIALPVAYGQIQYVHSLLQDEADYCRGDMPENWSYGKFGHRQTFTTPPAPPRRKPKRRRKTILRRNRRLRDYRIRKQNRIHPTQEAKRAANKQRRRKLSKHLNETSKKIRLAHSTTPRRSTTTKFHVTSPIPTTTADIPDEFVNELVQAHTLTKQLESDYRTEDSPYRLDAGGTCCTCNVGPIGAPGPRGGDGRDGIDGDVGAEGLNGIPAGPQDEMIIPQCTMCPPAPPGRPGQIGLQGRRGSSGRDGLEADGLVPGLPGPVGSLGPVGYPGPIGGFGQRGIPGIIERVEGLDGPPGPAGQSGRKGLEGDPGIVARSGGFGREGFRGDAGDRGVPGIPGIPGELGLEGERGNPGSCGHCPPPRLAPGY